MNLFELFVKIGVKDEASGQLSKIAGSLGSGLKAAAQVGVAAVSIAASGIAALTSAAVKNYAEYEQLVGGVETLFKESAQRVQEYAAAAYQSAGISANAYMETVTSFSASLLQSLGGDTQAAADLADQALRDMSDNANKMGTDMQTIINTYQSLARGNYAMLDNLKLGFGGTQAEMKRLIATAAELDSSVKANDMSFGNLVQAIHVVQTEMGISGITMEEYAQLVESGAMTQEEAWELLGTTAKEAATTIQGSVNAMKASWQNLLTGIADRNADIDRLMNEFVNSVGTVASNLLPVITQAIKGIGQLVTELAPIIANELPEMVNTVLPSLITAATALIAGFVTALVQMAPSLVTAAVALIEQLVQFLVDNLPMLIDSAINIVFALIDGIVQALPLLITAAVAIISELAVRLTDPATLTQLVLSAIAILGAICQGVFQNLPMLLEAAIQIVENLVRFLTDPSNLGKIIEEAAKLIMALATGLLNAAFELAIAAGELVGTIITAIFNTDWVAVGSNIVSAIADGFGAAWDTFTSWVSGETAGLGASGNAVGNGFTSGEAAVGNGFQNNSGVTINNNFYNSNLTAADVMREAQYNSNRAVMVN